MAPDIRSLPKVQPCNRKTELLCYKPGEQKLVTFRVYILGKAQRVKLYHIKCSGTARFLSWCSFMRSDTSPPLQYLQTDDVRRNDYNQQIELFYNQDISLKI